MITSRTKNIAGLFLLIVVVVFSGCSSETKEDVEKVILVNDPSFQSELDKRNAFQKELAEKRMDYLKQTNEINSAIRDLQERKVQIKNEYTDSVSRVKRQTQPMKRELERKLLEAEREYGHKKSNIGHIENDIEEITELVDKKEQLSLTQEEIQTWNDRLAALMDKKARLMAEMDKLKEDKEILKLKIKVMGVR